MCQLIRVRSFLAILMMLRLFEINFVETSNEVTNAVNNAFLNQLVNETFEKQKQTFFRKGGKTGKITIQLPFSFTHVYRAKL